MKSPVAGLCLIAIAGCSTAPVQDEQKGVPTDPDRTALTLPPPSSTYMRVGVEYLPPEDRRRHRPVSWLDHQGNHGRAQPGLVMVRDPRFAEPPRATDRPSRRLPELQEQWSLHRADIRKKRNPVERVALRFLAELIGDDRKRVQRAMGASLLGTQLRLSSDPMSNFLDERNREDQERLITKNGTRMFRRPSREAIKELPLLNNVENAIRDFKQANRKYTDKKELGLGRISMRLRLKSDPVELVWIRGGLRIASNQKFAKASLSTRPRQGLKISLRSKFTYSSDEWRLLGTLEYILNDYTTFYAIAGNEVNILGGPGSFPGGPQGEATSRGVLVYFLHEF